MKASPYERFAVPKLRVVDLAGAQILAFSGPENERYRFAERVDGDATLAFRIPPELSVKVAEILG